MAHLSASLSIRDWERDLHLDTNQQRAFQKIKMELLHRTRWLFASIYELQFPRWTHCLLSVCFLRETESDLCYLCLIPQGQGGKRFVVRSHFSVPSDELLHSNEPISSFSMFQSQWQTAKRVRYNNLLAILTHTCLYLSTNCTVNHSGPDHTELGIYSTH